MLLALIFRGVAFEFRFKANHKQQHIWDKAFICGSIITTFVQGVVVGAFIQGFPLLIELLWVAILTGLHLFRCSVDLA